MHRLRFAALFLYSLLALRPIAEAASAEVLPGTAWRLEAPGQWTAEERSALEALLPGLPDAYRRPGRAVTFRKGAAPRLEGDPEARHALARVNYLTRTVTLNIDGLEDSLGGWLEQVDARLQRTSSRETAAALARLLIQRQVVHELTHLLDRRHGWSSSSAWRQISGWPSARRLEPLPPDRDPEAFASPYGMTSPAEDLATTAEVYFLPPRLGPMEADEHPRCRLAAKHRFLDERVGSHPDPAPGVRCATLEEVALDPGQVADLEVLYVAPTLSAIASMAGHLMVAVTFRPDAQGVVRREAFGLVADARGVPEGSLAYVVRGVSGGFTARIDRKPLETVLMQYTELEDRDVRRYRLRLDAAQKRLVLQRLDELVQRWHRPYFFFQRNCTQLVLELARPVVGQELELPRFVAPDAVMAQLYRKGLLEPLSVDRVETLALTTRAHQAIPVREAAASALLDRDGGASAPLREALALLEEVDAGRRSRGYELLQQASASLEMTQLVTLKRLLQASDPLERSLALQQHRRSGDRDGSQVAMRALIDARLALRAREDAQPEPGAPGDAAEQDLPEPADAPEQEPLVPADAQEQEPLKPADAPDRALPGPPPQATGGGSRFTAYQPFQLGVAAAWGATGPHTYLVIGNSALAPRMGERRMFRLSEGLSLDVLKSELRLELPYARPLITRFMLLDGTYIPAPLLGGIRHGWSARLLDVTVRHGGMLPGWTVDADASTNEGEPPPELSLEATWARLGPTWELWQANAHRISLQAGAGLEVGSSLDLRALARSPEPVALSVPMHLELGIASPRQALTGLRARVEYAPGWVPGRALEQRVVLNALGRVRIGEVLDTDVALGVEYAGEWEGSFDGMPGRRVQTLGVGVWLERF